MANSAGGAHRVILKISKLLYMKFFLILGEKKMCTIIKLDISSS